MYEEKQSSRGNLLSTYNVPKNVLSTSETKMNNIACSPLKRYLGINDVKFKKVV